MDFNQIRALERAKDCYMLDARMSIADCVKYATAWDSMLFEDTISSIRSAARTAHIVQWEIEHSREDGVALFDAAISQVKSLPETPPSIWLLIVSPASFFIAGLGIAYSFGWI